MDKRVFILGVAMLAAGGLSWLYFNNTIPIANPGMSEQETNAFYQAEASLRGVESGNKELARAEVNTAMKLAANRDVRAMSGLALARAGIQQERRGW